PEEGELVAEVAAVRRCQVAGVVPPLGLVGRVRAVIGRKVEAGRPLDACEPLDLRLCGKKACPGLLLAAPQEQHARSEQGDERQQGHSKTGYRLHKYDSNSVHGVRVFTLGLYRAAQASFKPGERSA